MDSQTATSPNAGRAPRWLRRFVAVFLIVFAACGLIGIEVWPLTGWRLFADARERTQAGWQATAVDAAGRERPIDFGRLPAGFQGDVQVLGGFSSLDPDARAAVCDAWTEALRDRGQEVVEIRISTTRTDVGDRHGGRGAPPERTLRYVCADGAVREAAADGA